MALITKLLALLLAVCLAAAPLASCHAERRERPTSHGGGHQATPAHAGRHGTGGAGLLPPPTPADGGDPAAELAAFKPIGAIPLTYDVAQAGGYGRFHTSLHQLLKTNKVVETPPVVVRQTAPAPPPTWILPTLTAGRSSREKLTMAMRNDNGYIVAFSNSEGVWFAFPRFRSLVDGAITLAKEETYGSLVGGHEKLKDYGITTETVLEAVRFLASYRSTMVGDKNYEDKLGISLARLIVVVAEAARFKNVYSTVEKGLAQQQAQTQARMTEKEAKLVVLWGDLSRSIIALKKTGKWVQKDGYSAAGVASAQDAIDTLRLLIWPKGEELATF